MIKPGIFLHSSKKAFSTKNALIYILSFATSHLGSLKSINVESFWCFLYGFHSFLGFIRVCQNGSAVCMIPIMLTTSLKTLKMLKTNNWHLWNLKWLPFWSVPSQIPQWGKAWTSYHQSCAVLSEKDYLSNQAHSRAPSSSSSHPQSSPGPPRQELSNTNSSNHLSLPDKLSFVLQLRPIFVCVLVFVPVVFIVMFKAFHDRLVLFLELFTI